MLKYNTVWSNVVKLYLILIIHIVANNVATVYCIASYIRSSPFFTQCPSRHGPSVIIKLLVVCRASILLMIPIYLIILVSSQSILVSWLSRNSWPTCVYSTCEFHLVAELYCSINIIQFTLSHTSYNDILCVVKLPHMWFWRSHALLEINLLIVAFYGSLGTATKRLNRSIIVTV